MIDRFLADETWISNLLLEIKKDFGFKKNKDLLHIDATTIFKDNLNIFKNKSSPKINMKTPQDWNISSEVKGKYQMIFCNFPWRIKDGPDERGLVLDSLDLLKSDGIGVYLMPPLWRTFVKKGENFQKEIYKNGFKILAVIQMPSSFMKMTSIKPSLLFISRQNEISETFFAKYQDYNLQKQWISFGIRQIYDINFRKKLDKQSEDLEKYFLNEGGHTKESLARIKEESKNLYNGIEENFKDFLGFEYWEQKQEITNLETEYHGYKYEKLEDFAKINTTRDVFDDLDNAIYIPAIGKTEVLKEMPNLNSKKKPQNYFQVLCKSEDLLIEYLFIFLNSDFGQKTIETEFSKYSESTIRRLRVSDIRNLYIPLPSIGIQRQIIENINKLQKIKDVFNKIEKSLSIKPISSSTQLAKLDQIYKSSVKLSEPEIVLSEIKKGESTEREFKQTFALDVKLKKRGDHIVQECVKTVAGFMNKSGGTLFIGVADNSEITGIEVEVGKTKLHKSLDKYMNTIKDILKKRIGSASLSNCDFKHVKIRGKTILKIECSQSDHEVFVEKDFYVRMGPSTNKLEGRELATFIKDRFN